MATRPSKYSAKRCLRHWQLKIQRLRSEHFGDTLSELRGMESLHTLSDTVAANKVESLGDI